MDLRQLNRFVRVADVGNFTLASTLCHISQPALSRQIANLEKEIGVPLFLREARSVTLTSAGKAFLPEARATLAHAAAAKRDAVNGANHATGEIVVGLASLPSYVFAPSILKGFRAAHSELRVTIVRKPAIELNDALKAGRTDINFTPLPIYDPSTASCQLRVERLVVALPNDDDLTSRTTLSVDQLASRCFITYPRGGGVNTYDRLVALCNASGFEPQIAAETTPTENVICMVASGAGVAIVPEGVQCFGATGVTYRYLVKNGRRPMTYMTVPFGVAWRRRALSQQSNALLEFARNW